MASSELAGQYMELLDGNDLHRVHASGPYPRHPDYGKRQAEKCEGKALPRPGTPLLIGIHPHTLHTECART